MRHFFFWLLFAFSLCWYAQAAQHPFFVDAKNYALYEERAHTLFEAQQTIHGRLWSWLKKNSPIATRRRAHAGLFATWLRHQQSDYGQAAATAALVEFAPIQFARLIRPLVDKHLVHQTLMALHQLYQAKGSEGPFCVPIAQTLYTLIARGLPKKIAHRHIYTCLRRLRRNFTSFDLAQPAIAAAYTQFTRGILHFIAPISRSIISHFVPSPKAATNTSNTQSAAIESRRADLIRQYEAEPLTLTTDDGLNIAALLIHRPHATINVVICHGYTETKERKSWIIDLFPQANILLFDFRAHGQSDGDMVSFGFYEYLDVIAACRFMRENAHTAPLPIALVAFSMGGAAAIRAIYFQPSLCDLIIADSTYADFWHAIKHLLNCNTGILGRVWATVTTMAANMYGNAPLGTLRPRDCVPSMAQPMLIIHSPVDAIAPFKGAWDLFNRIPHHQKEFWRSPHVPHASIADFMPEEYRKRIHCFFGRFFH